MELKMNTFHWVLLDRLFRWIPLGLLGWLALLISGAALRSLHISGQAEAAITAYNRIHAEAVASKEDGHERIKKLTEKNLFAPPAEKPKPPQCTAILGNSALFGDKWHTLGETVQGAKILDIGPTFVKVVFEGKEQNIVPFDMEIKPNAAGSPPPPELNGNRSRPPQGSTPVTGPPRPDSGRPGERGQMRRRLESLTPEQRQQMMERYQNASPEEQEQMRQQFRDRE
jgi:hypothetical protein